MPDNTAPPVPTWVPLPPDQQPLTPHSSFQEMAQSVVGSSAIAFDYLAKCQACGLPCDDRLQELRDHVDFCRNFLKYHYGQDDV